MHGQCLKMQFVLASNETYIEILHQKGFLGRLDAVMVHLIAVFYSLEIL